MKYILPSAYRNSTHPVSMLYAQLTNFFMTTHSCFNLAFSFLGLLVWRWAAWWHHFESAYLRTSRNKQIIRTRLQLRRSGSDYFGLVPLTGVEPVRFLRRGILSPLCLPIPPQRRDRSYFTICRPIRQALQAAFWKIIGHLSQKNFPDFDRMTNSTSPVSSKIVLLA